METELKFQVPRASRAALQAAVATATARTTRLQAVYVETAGRHLAQAGLALRLRLEGRVWVQTLKGRGDGVMNRLEHEVTLPRQRGVPTLDLQRHAGTPAGERLAAALPPGAALQTLYRTDIRRLHRRVRSGGAVIEIAHDRGWLIAGDAAAGQPERRQAVHEIEFELLSGPPAALAVFASRWAERHGLWWDCRTKSEQGMRLALGLRTVPATRATAASRRRGLPADERASARVQNALGHLLPNVAELVSGSGDAGHLAQMRLALRALKLGMRLAVVTSTDPAKDALIGWPTPAQAASPAWWAGASAQRLLLGSLAWALTVK